MIKFSRCVNTMPVNTLIKPIERTSKSRLKTKRNQTEILIQVNELENRLNEINKNLKMKKKKRKKKMPNPIIMTMMFRFMKDLERKDKPKKKRKKKKKKVKELNESDKISPVNTKKIKEEEQKKTTESSGMRSETLKEEHLSKKANKDKASDRRLKPLNYISILSNNFEQKKSPINKGKSGLWKKTTNSLILTEKTDTVGTKKEETQMPIKQLDKSKFTKLYKAYDKLSFILYLNRKYKEIKDKRKQYAYKFYDDHFEKINKSIYELMYTATKDILTKFMNNKKIIDFTSQHINSTKIHSVIREYTVSLLDDHQRSHNDLK